MNELKTFQSEQFGQVRTVDFDGEPWFVAADVCYALDISNSRDAVSRLDDDEKGVASTDTHGGRQDVQVVSESGLYTLVLGSRKPEAKLYKRWITHEVIPSIRKHGAYMTPETIEKALLNPDFLIGLATKLKEEQEKNLALLAANSKLAVQYQIALPKAEYFDQLVDRNLLTSFRDTARELKLGQKNFVRFLLDKRFIFRDKKGKLQPYANANNGYFEVKECFNEKSDWVGQQTMITPKGREAFRLLLED